MQYPNAKFLIILRLGIDFSQERGIVYLNARTRGGATGFDKKRFKACVVLVGLTLRQVAAALSIDEATLYRKMNGDSDFYRREIQQLCNLLKIDNPAHIFFANKLT